MEPRNVVLYQGDAETAERLTSTLSRYFPSIHRIQRREEIRSAISQTSAELLVLDVESSGTEAVERLHREFPGLYIVCTHRLANDELWTEALNQGAADLCVPWNTEEVVRALTREHARRDAA